MSNNSSSSSSSSSTNASLPSSNSSLSHPYTCSDSAVSAHTLTAFSCTYLLLLIPFSILVFYVGVQQRRRQRSVSTAMTTSNSDLFTYHMIIIELIGFLGSFLYSCGFYNNLPRMLLAGVYTLFFVFLGRLLFHCLTCVDRYLAVVHPITYLGLKKTGGARVRNISTGGAWLLCFGWVGLVFVYSPHLPTIPFFCFSGFSLLLIFFCSLSVLCALVRPGPGGMGKDRERVNQSKRRAFHTIMAIMGALLLKYLAVVVCTVLHISQLLSYNDGCVVLLSAFWFSLPSSLVLPLLFLHRAGKLSCCRHKVESR